VTPIFEPALFDKVLIANRGEIAVRVIRTLDRLGIASVAVYSDADAGAAHVRAAGQAIRLGPAPARESYLRIEQIIEAATATGAEAIHPGYGFLAENAAFARASEAAGLVFIGPSAAAMEVMGDKIRAKAAVAAVGVPVVPGRAEPGMTDADLIDAAAEVGYPVLVKPSAGGGGKGMRLVDDPAALPEALTGARREAAASFGDDTLFLERFVTRPRHIEVQVMADAHGTVVHLGERECSLQRRHQKVIEEAPSVLLDAATRARIGASACDTARSVDYRGAGTVEFIVGADRPDEYFFMEMNTRLQVEHPVTEMVTGLDLVEMQLRVAAGERLGLTQDDVVLTGHAVEGRVYAEDPAHGFLPTGGRALLVIEPNGDGVRVDSSLTVGLDVSMDYDPMLSKVIAWGPDRPTALRRLGRALGQTTVLGLRTNVAFLGALVRHPDVQAGRLDTGLIERELESLIERRPPAPAYAAAGLLRLARAWPTGDRIDPWDVPNGWRVGAPRAVTVLFRSTGTDPVAVTVTGSPGSARVRVGEDEEVTASVSLNGDCDRALVTLADRSFPVITATEGPVTWVALDGATWALSEVSPVVRRGATGAPVGANVRSPMPGTVISVRVEAGAAVTTGQTVMVLEAMKMEYSLVASTSGTVELLVRAGDRVSLDQVLARVNATPELAET
jgi:acetyl-CoA/propionyl-CoA carboxylase biotin carboxyl carrier protein